MNFSLKNKIAYIKFWKSTNLLKYIKKRSWQCGIIWIISLINEVIAIVVTLLQYSNH